VTRAKDTPGSDIGNIAIIWYAALTF